jgi:HprK-related kinase A
MQQLNDLPAENIRIRLKRGELHLHIGPYIYNLRSNLSRVAEGVETLYRNFPLASPGVFADYRVAMNHRSLLPLSRGKVEFLFDHQSPFGYIPTGQAYAFMEWGMNWCVSTQANEYLKLHAAAVARDGAAIIMPGVPGAGKSTLCAAMGLTGWRILSDEHALIPPGTSEVVPLCRPVSLKNESISLIESFSTKAIFGPISEDTHKGVVAHMKGDLVPDSHDSRTVPARIMLFPRYSKDDQQRLNPRRRTESFILAAYHSFNYSLLGEDGFQAMKTLVDSVECYDLIYHDLDWALKSIEVLHDRTCAQ